jgi:2-polyprenyl-3-methyl-5-hydroxy-6-metoxy-1,4-benzoquinol methylase
VRGYYEDLWASLPKDLQLPEFERRLEFLLAHMQAGDRVLDLGCGAGEFTQGAADAGATVTAVEIAEAALSRARQRHPDLDFRLTPLSGPLPLADNEFDLVWASEVIEHVADTARWLSEVRRVLKPAGQVLITTPNHGRLRLLLGGIERYSEPLGDHLHLYTAHSLRELLADFGFIVRVVGATGGPPLMRTTLYARASR